MLQQNLVRFLDLVEAISFRFRLLMAKAKLFARLDVVCDLCNRTPSSSKLCQSHLEELLLNREMAGTLNRNGRPTQIGG